jgi:Icc-related predicted phosphoesterase
MIWFVGDTHGQFDHVLRAVKRSPPAALIFVGDLECPARLDEVLAPILDDTEIWFIPGNHDVDNDDLWQRLTQGPLAARNLHGRVVEIAGHRVAGLGGVFESAVWLPPDDPVAGSYEELIEQLEPPWQTRRSAAKQVIVDSKKLKHRATIFPETYLRLAAERAGILVTHEAPSCHPHGSAAIDELAQALGVKRAFHGHHHDCLDYSGDAARLGFRAHGVGLCGITNEVGEVVIAGSLDDQRAARSLDWPM